MSCSFTIHSTQPISITIRSGNLPNAMSTDKKVGAVNCKVTVEVRGSNPGGPITITLFDDYSNPGPEATPSNPRVETSDTTLVEPTVHQLLFQHRKRLPTGEIVPEDYSENTVHEKKADMNVIDIGCDENRVVESSLSPRSKEMGKEIQIEASSPSLSTPLKDSTHSNILKRKWSSDIHTEPETV
ncbi:uncharacterized protein C8R40DRAFT_1165894 [Lentinula edodes]|uniref:uncharacterized protein n=1 Tax=Lentinula edodes TaxID=5353 RepID=UPI001E8DF651|nr:uncharacterized protein C8R40DRAFT_1165894 [Lentinula edodes]KAH7879639.1 hypothetical protein C8R40DRAFT_1165894 [Lentinula edodes]